MKRIIVKCVCGSTTLWSEDVDDGSREFTTQEGVGDEQSCCQKPVKHEDKGDYMLRHMEQGVKPLKKDKRR
jgi:hypothetical protein